MAENTLPLFTDAGKFYVYVYRDPRPRKKRAPIYVGKGTAKHKRADVHWRHRSDNIILRRVLAKIRTAELEPIVEIVGWFENECDAFAYETFLIKKFGRRDNATGTLCNLTDGGEGASGHTLSEESRQKISRALTGRKNGPPSEETRRKISEANTGVTRARSEEAKRKTSETLKATYASGKRTHRGGMAGKQHSDETKAKMRAAALGRVISAEQRAAISARHTGRKHSPEEIERRRKSLLAAWVRRKQQKA